MLRCFFRDAGDYPPAPHVREQTELATTHWTNRNDSYEHHSLATTTVLYPLVLHFVISRHEDIGDIEAHQQSVALQITAASHGC